MIEQTLQLVKLLAVFSDETRNNVWFLISLLLMAFIWWLWESRRAVQKKLRTRELNGRPWRELSLFLNENTYFLSDDLAVTCSLTSVHDITKFKVKFNRDFCCRIQVFGFRDEKVEYYHLSSMGIGTEQSHTTAEISIPGFEGYRYEVSVREVFDDGEIFGLHLRDR